MPDDPSRNTSSFIPDMIIDEAFKVLIENGIEESILYERKPLTRTETEKLIGKNKFDRDYITKQ